MFTPKGNPHPHSQKPFISRWRSLEEGEEERRGVMISPLGRSFPHFSPTSPLRKFASFLPCRVSGPNFPAAAKCAIPLFRSLFLAFPPAGSRSFAAAAAAVDDVGILQISRQHFFYIVFCISLSTDLENYSNLVFIYNIVLDDRVTLKYLKSKYEAYPLASVSLISLSSPDISSHLNSI
jgi:hypothetical protein